jgi:hypothetical protein
LQAKRTAQNKNKKQQKKLVKKQKDEKKRLPGVTYTAGGKPYKAASTGEQSGTEYIIHDINETFSTIESVLHTDGAQVSVWKCI